MYAVETFGLTKVFGGKVAVNNLYLKVKRGEIYGFLGPNGAGKTTTIKMLTCILNPTSGTAKVEGYDIIRDRMKVKEITGYSPEYPLVYESLTVREFLDFMASIRGIPNTSRKEKIKELTDYFDLKLVLNKQIRGLSKGEKKKINLAAAFLHDPKVVFLDEPLMGLDALTAVKVKTILNEFVRHGSTVFLSTHIMEIAEKLCTYIAVINQGKIVAEGKIPDLKSKINVETLEEAFLKATGC